MSTLGESRMRPHWSVSEAIKKQVEREDLVFWANEPVPEIPKEVLAREIPTTKWKATALYVFGINIRTLTRLMP